MTLVTCPRCGCNSLSVSECTENWGTTDFGPVSIEGGAIIPPGPFDFEPGGILRVLLTCESCRHEWPSRRPVGMVVAP